MIDDDLLVSEEHYLKGLPRTRRHKTPEMSLVQAQNSVYRWWWEYLRLSRDYWMVCQTSSSANIRTQDEKLRRVYRRFGDIHNCSFDDWWLDRGYRVFSEQEKFPKVAVIPSRPSERQHQVPSDDKIWVEIPLKLSKRTIQKQLGKVLDEYESSRLRRRLELSSADFKVNPAPIGTHVLQKVHEVHALHRELIDKPKWQLQHKSTIASAPERADLFRIGKLLRLSPSNESMRGEPGEIRARLNRMRVAVSRLDKRSKLLIANVEVGIFPSYKALELSAPRFNTRQLEMHQELESKWWELTLMSGLSADKLARVAGIRYEEPERTRQNDLYLNRPERRVLTRDA